MSQKEPKSDQLPPKQARLALCLLQGLSLNNAAAIVGVSYCTAKRWAKLPEVVAAIKDGTNNLISQTQLDLLSKVACAVGVLHDLAIDGTQPAQIRRQSASDIVGLALRAVADHDRRWMVELAKEQEAIREEFAHAKQRDSRGYVPTPHAPFGPGGQPHPGFGLSDE